MASKWHRELDVFAQIKSGIILEGNVNDIYIFPEGELAGSTLPLTNYLYYFFKQRGYSTIVYYDLLNHFTSPYDSTSLKSFCEIVGVASTENNGVPSVRSGLTAANNGMPELTNRLMTQNQSPAVLIMDMVSRYIVGPDSISQDEVYAFASIQKTIANSREVRLQDGTRKRNIVILIASKQNDLPAWFFLNNPTVKTLNIGYPSAEERSALLSENNLPSFFAPDIYQSQLGNFSPSDLEKLKNRFVARTEGFTNFEMANLRNLSRSQRTNLNELCSVVDLYTYGIKENPWQSSELIEKLEGAEEFFNNRVKGQDPAIRQTLDVIKRSVVGMSGAQHSSDTKPKGVLFFAGPTGTGKTETAKTLAELIFGDERACIRFDMSEYSQSHSDQRLLGAPPGYVGYEAGGQLTNAIRKNPFSILLFDEIEKAAPSIMDKFLQILEDGRMTDGQGHTVYFSECIIIFTSNLGTTVTDEYGHREENVNMNMTYAEVQSKVRAAIEEHFKIKLGRPEILNRIGENVVVFDYIRKNVARSILDARLEKIRHSLLENKRIALEWNPCVGDELMQLAIGNLNNGGRGIMNIIEYAWINPLSRLMFDRKVLSDASITVRHVRADHTPVELECEVKR